MSNIAIDKLTSLIISKLEQGEIPWKKPWKNYPRPANYVTLRRYNGFNAFVLWVTAADKNYDSNLWLTWKQCKTLGGSIKHGEHGSVVVYWDTIVKDKPEANWTAKDREKAERGERVTEKHWFMKFYYVFNYCQTEGLPSKDTQVVHKEPIAECEKIIAGYADKPQVVSATAAWYNRGSDTVGIPGKTQFPEQEGYYATIFHEFSHSTGHEKRLNREEVVKGNLFGTGDYSKEELTAELSSAFLCAEAGIAPKTIDNAAAYIQSWLKALKNDKKQVIWAATRGQKAANYILGIKQDEQGGE